MCRWLTAAGMPFDVASSPVLADGLDLDRLDPRRYDRLVFACGPLGGWQVADLAARFAHCRKVAIGVSLVGDPAADAFDVVLARDGHRHGLADLAFAAPTPPLPVVGVVRAPHQPEYADGRHHAVHAVVDAWLAHAEVAGLDIDTRVDPRIPGARTPAQVTARLAHCDAVVTTRLHGLVLSLAAGVPAVAVDPVAGGAKVTAQARSLGWPACLPADGLDVGGLDTAVRWALGPQAVAALTVSTGRARRDADRLRPALIGALTGRAPGPPRCPTAHPDGRTASRAGPTA